LPVRSRRTSPRRRSSRRSSPPTRRATRTTYAGRLARLSCTSQSRSAASQMRGALSPIRERICPSRPRSFADAVSMIPTAAAESGALHRGPRRRHDGSDRRPCLRVARGLARPGTSFVMGVSASTRGWTESDSEAMSCAGFRARRWQTALPPSAEEANPGAGSRAPRTGGVMLTRRPA
jgi:hypothetical protein